MLHEGDNLPFREALPNALLAGCLSVWLAGWMAGWLAGCWLAGWLSGCLACWLASCRHLVSYSQTRSPSYTRWSKAKKHVISAYSQTQSPSYTRWLKMESATIPVQSPYSPCYSPRPVPVFHSFAKRSFGVYTKELLKKIYFF